MQSLTVLEENTRAAERGLLAAILVQPTLVEEAILYVSRSSFFDCDLGQFFELLADSWEAKQWKGDIRTLLPILRSRQMLDRLGGAAEIGRLASEGLPNNARFFQLEVQRFATLRRMGLELLKASDECREATSDPVALAGRIEALATLGHNVADDAVVSNKAILEETWEDIEKSQAIGKGQGLRCGLPSLDGESGAFFESEVTVLAARPSMGKTALAMEIAYRIAKDGRRVFFVSLEMGSKALAYRLYCRHTGIPVRRMQSGTMTQQELLSVRIAKEELSDFEILNLIATEATVPEVKARARIANSMKPIDLIVVDYLGLMSTKQPMKIYERVTQISRQIKAMAIAMNKPLLILHQLNRAEGKPTLEHLRDSGAIEQDADNVWLIHRESRESQDMEVIIAKQRQGPVGSVFLEFFGKEMRIEEKGYAAGVEFTGDFGEFGG